MPEDFFAKVFSDSFSVVDEVLDKNRNLFFEEVGSVISVDNGIASASGLNSVQSKELVRFVGDKFGIVFNLEPDEIGIVLLDKAEEVKTGHEITRTGKVMSCPVGEGLLGRVIDPAGRVLDRKGSLNTVEVMPIERGAPSITERLPVIEPLQTGIISVDAMIPIGKGQRELILGDRQIGKTVIALNTMINNPDLFCVYCAIGQKSSAVKKLIIDLEKYGALKRSVIVVATGEDSPGMNFIAPYAATSIAEYFMRKGNDALIVYDDLTRHAWAYRELSLLLRRPPTREAYPGDIFYIHSRLLERATHLKSGGSLTAFPIIETQAQDIAAYIPTNLISITDGQIYLSPTLFQDGILPAIDIGKSVSRVGGKSRLPAYHDIAGRLRLVYSRFEELESFFRFGTQKNLQRGYRIKEVLKQGEFERIDVASQIFILLAVTEGIFDEIALNKISPLKKVIQENKDEDLAKISVKIKGGGKLSDEDKKLVVEKVKKITDGFR